MIPSYVKCQYRARDSYLAQIIGISTQFPEGSEVYHLHDEDEDVKRKMLQKHGGQNTRIGWNWDWEKDREIFAQI